jgi:phage shock protein PspC (stress-responsive transcriptional regulator)
MNTFTRPVSGRWIAGVCTGLARSTGIDVTAVRILSVLLAGIAIPVYVVLWVFSPSGDRDLP